MLIGKTITIKEARNQSLNNKHGTVINETKHTITITDSKTHKDITIIKDQLITIEETP